MPNKIKVYGKAQNRTVLGIAHAYLVMYPHASLADLRKALPNSLCPDSGVKELFVSLAEAEAANAKGMSLYFAKPDEVLALADGTKAAMAQVWSKPSFERAVAQGAVYGIEVAEFERTSQPGQKGGYRLEYLNGYVPPVPEKRRSLLWLWILLLLLGAGLILWFVFGNKKQDTTPVQPQIIEKVVEKEVIVRDTVYMQQIEDIERNFNAAQFDKGKADLNDDAKLALHDLARVMKQNPELRLNISGHTSSEGSEEVNRKLSEARARAAVEFLTDKEGISADRLTATGYGSSKPVSDTPEENRRTEFEII